MHHNDFLKANFEEIKNIITQSWQHKKSANFSITYIEEERKIEVEFKERDDYPGFTNFEYDEKDHDCMDSFFNDLNTDICIAELADKYPELDIQGCAWPDNQIFVGDKVMNNFDDFFSPKDGVFHIDIFLQKKYQLEFGSRSLLSNASLLNSTRSLNNNSAPYPKSYQSELFIPLTYSNNSRKL